jgi:hypothetical protein
VISAIAFELGPQETAISIKRRHLVAITPRGVPPDRVSPPLAALPTIKPPVPSAVALPGYLSFGCQSRLSRSPFVSNHPRSPAAAPLWPPWCPNHFTPFNSMSDLVLPRSILTVPGAASHSSTLRSRLPRQQPDSDADHAMEYLALEARQLTARALAFDPHARPCPSPHVIASA